MDSEEDESEIDKVSVMTEVVDDPERESEEEENSNLMGADNLTLGEQRTKEWGNTAIVDYSKSNHQAETKVC